MTPISIGPDNAGTRPQEGDYVAYNWSGSIATGTIVRITKSWVVHIQRELPAPRGSRYDRGMSRIKGGPSCLLVLRKGDGTYVRAALQPN